MLEIAFLNYEFVFLEGAFPRPSSLHHWQLRIPMKIIVTLTVLVNHWIYNWRGRGGRGVVGTLTNENQGEGFHPPNLSTLPPCSTFKFKYGAYSGCTSYM